MPVARRGARRAAWLGRERGRASRRRKMPVSLGTILRGWTATLDAIEDLISVHDWEHRIIRANRALASRLGCEPAELIGQHCYRLFHGSDTPPLDCPHRKARETGRTAHQEMAGTRVGDILRVTCSPYCDEGGQPVGTVHVARDISKEKRREEEREALISRLQEALAQAKVLRGLLPICSSCKKIRDDQGSWRAMEDYIRERSDADFTHGICPDCAQELYPRWVEARRKRER